MAIHVAEHLGAPQAYRFTDPDALLSCDNPACFTPWVTRTGLVCWRLRERVPSGSWFTDRVLVACSPVCLAAARQSRGSRIAQWSDPMPIGEWLNALGDSLDREPDLTPVGEFTTAN